MIDENTLIDTSDKILRIALYKAFDGKCFYTGRPVSLEDMHIDHIDPVSNGGKNCISNYVLSCSYINLKKNDTINYNFKIVAQSIVSLIFAKLVILEYNNLINNQTITNEYVDLHKYLKDKNLSPNEINRIKGKAQLKFNIIKTKPLNLATGKPLSKNKNYILESDLLSII